MLRQLQPWFENVSKRQYPGTETYKVHERVEVVPLPKAAGMMAKIGTERT